MNEHQTIEELLDNVMSGNLVESKDTFESTLSNKIANKLKETKDRLCSEKYNPNLDANKNGKLDADDFKKLRAKKHKSSCCEETVEDALNEVLNPSMGIKTYIDDFIKSDDPRFKGDSKEKRRQRAIAAFYSDKK